MVSSALGDTPCLKLTGRSCPDISGSRGAAAGRVYMLSETCLGCVWAEVPAVADSAPFLDSLPTTPNTPLPKRCACGVYRTGSIETRCCRAQQPGPVLLAVPTPPGDPPLLPFQLPGQKHNPSTSVSENPGAFPRGLVCGMTSLGAYSCPSARVCL